MQGQRHIGNHEIPDILDFRIIDTQFGSSLASADKNILSVGIKIAADLAADLANLHATASRDVNEQTSRPYGSRTAPRLPPAADLIVCSCILVSGAHHKRAAQPRIAAALVVGGIPLVKTHFVLNIVHHKRRPGMDVCALVYTGIVLDRVAKAIGTHADSHTVLDMDGAGEG